ncbi:MAG: ATP-binding cassette domain-containing protein [Planctomycetes bacterium]|nr:ATP-binding cassette domain-containing protein [Planctomycetota bacterium]
MWFSHHLSIRENEIAGGRYGLHFMYCHDSTVAGNRLTGNSVGAYLMYSQRLKLEGNRIEGNRGPSGYGIGLKDMEDSQVSANLLAGNKAGFFLEGSRGNFVRNFVVYNDRGLVIFPSASGNLFEANAFSENGEQVIIEGLPGIMTTNTWRGNFWSDYVGFDAGGDGKGDVPYRPVQLFERLATRHSALRLFAENPATEAIDFASRLFPVFEPQPKFIDLEPLMAPPPLPVSTFKPRSSGLLKWLFLSMGLLLWPLSILLRLKPPAAAAIRPQGNGANGNVSGAPPVEPVAISVFRLAKRFGKVEAIGDLSFEVRQGEAVALWGPNGAGKTTVLRCLLGLFPFEGKAHVQGLACGCRGKASRQRLGYVPQEIRFHPDPSVWETICFYAHLRKSSIDRARMLLLEWNLREVMHRPVRHLSGGMLQKLAVVIALLSDPPVLLLDEPTSNLDARARQEFSALLERLKKAGKTLLFCSHRASEVWRLADRVIVLEGGRKIAEGSPEEVRRHLLKGAVLCLTVPVERCAEAAQALDSCGFGVRRNGTQIWIDVPAGRKLEPVERLIEAGVPILDFELDSGRGYASPEK